MNNQNIHSLVNLSTTKTTKKSVKDTKKILKQLKSGLNYNSYYIIKFNKKPFYIPFFLWSFILKKFLNLKNKCL